MDLQHHRVPAPRPRLPNAGLGDFLRPKLLANVDTGFSEVLHHPPTLTAKPLFILRFLQPQRYRVQMYRRRMDTAMLHRDSLFVLLAQPQVDAPAVRKTVHALLRQRISLSDLDWQLGTARFARVGNRPDSKGLGDLSAMAETVLDHLEEILHGPHHGHLSAKARAVLAELRRGIEESLETDALLLHGGNASRP